MLARYKIYRGKRPADEKLPDGIRQDTRKHTRHCLRPSAEIVEEFLARPSSSAWQEFAAEYRRTLAERFAANSQPYDDLANLAIDNDVYLGCSCPTAKNPNINHCHTVLALFFMQARYPDMTVVFP